MFVLYNIIIHIILFFKIIKTIIKHIQIAKKLIDKFYKIDQTLLILNALINHFIF